jgi:hypothetical protein
MAPSDSRSPQWFVAYSFDREHTRTKRGCAIGFFGKAHQQERGKIVFLSSRRIRLLRELLLPRGLTTAIAVCPGCRRYFRWASHLEGSCEVCMTPRIRYFRIEQIVKHNVGEPLNRPISDAKVDGSSTLRISSQVLYRTSNPDQEIIA